MTRVNGKYPKTISKPFNHEYRNTDIPGTIKNPSHQKNGPDNDVIIEVNAEVNKASLKLGNVNFAKQLNNRESIDKTNQMPGRYNSKGMGTSSDPWDYDVNKIWHGHRRQSTYKNRQSLVRDFDKQIPRT